MKYSVSALVLGFFAALSASAPTPDDKPDTIQVIITGVIYPGSGCPAGKAAVSHSPDWSTLTTISYSTNTRQLSVPMPRFPTVSRCATSSSRFTTPQATNTPYTRRTSQDMAYSKKESLSSRRHRIGSLVSSAISQPPCLPCMDHTMATTPSPILFSTLSGRHTALPPP